MAAEHSTQTRLRRAYELGRVRNASLSASPMVAIALMSGCCGTSVTSAVTLGLAGILWVFSLRYVGRDLGKSVLPGLLAGLLPLGLALGARALGHVCTPDGCVSLCVPACSVGGVLAGVWVGLSARRSASPLLFSAAGMVLAGLVGSLGCSCVGASGIVGLIGGLVAGSVVSRPWRGDSKSFA